MQPDGVHAVCGKLLKKPLRIRTDLRIAKRIAVVREVAEYQPEIERRIRSGAAPGGVLLNVHYLLDEREARLFRGLGVESFATKDIRDPKPRGATCGGVRRTVGERFAERLYGAELDP